MNARQLGTTNDSHFLDEFYSPFTEWPKISSNYLQLPEKYSFDLTEMRQECEKLTENFKLKPFPIRAADGSTRERLSYRGLGLSARPGSDDPLYDGLHLYGQGGTELNIRETFAKMSERMSGKERQVAILDESGFSELTSACGDYFQKILARFNSPFSKVRLLELYPGGIIPPHFDFPYYRGIRVHAAIHTTPDVIWEVDGEQFSLPADGNFYWFDTGKYHAVRNFGKKPRLVLSINLLVYQDRSGALRHGPQDTLENLIAKGQL